MKNLAAVLIFSACVAQAQAQAQERDATVIVDVQIAGPEKLAAIKHESGVLWSIEFGSQLLLGVTPSAHSRLQSLAGAQAGPGAVAREELLIRGHVCAHEVKISTWAVVGGYELLRVPAPLARMQALVDPSLQLAPADGVFARAKANEANPPAAMPLQRSTSSLVARVDAERWFQTMSTLSSFNRNSYSAQLFSARDWIRDRFVESKLTPSDFNFELSNITSCTPTPAPVTLPNIVGRKQGTTLPDEWVVIGAHFDSRNASRCDGVVNVQPGANDNASGCAGVIELARVFANVATQRSMLFMCFSGEEQGLVGSRRYVDALVASGDISKVKLMLNMDMIGFDPNGTNTARIESRTQFQSLINRFSSAAATYAPELAIITNSNASAGSDHWHFLQAGVPAVVTWENGASIYPHYHKATDLPQNMTGARALAGGILKMDTAVLATEVGLIEMDLFADGFE